MSGIKETLRHALERQQSHWFLVTNDILAAVTLLSVVAIVLETVESLASYEHVFRVIEYGAVVLFTAEYVGRVFIAQRKLGYVFSFFGIIDLLAIAPTYLSLANLTFLKTARVFRILRFLRIVRIAKLARIQHTQKKDTGGLYLLNMQIYGTALLGAVLVLGGALYLAEGQQDFAKDMPSAMWWTFKIIVGGLGSYAPTTTVGVVLLVATRFVGLILFGLLVGLLGTLMRKTLIGSEKD